jgi:hypothetical protein
MDPDTQDTGDTAGPDIRWLSYSELAEALHMKRSSAIRTTLRRGWQRRPGNDQSIRVGVPAAVLAGEHKPPAPEHRARQSAPGQSLAIKALADAVGELKAALAREVSRADKAEAEVERLRALIEELEAPHPGPQEAAQAAPAVEAPMSQPEPEPAPTASLGPPVALPWWRRLWPT